MRPESLRLDRARIWLALTLTAVLAAAVAACAKKLERTLTIPQAVATLDRRSPYLKAHMRDGTVYVLSPWGVDSAAHTVTGTGQLLDPNRALIREGTLTLPIDSVALFETNVVRPSPAIGALAVITGASVALTIYCAANPKACFGSCPTFYVSDGQREVLAAEGFSASVAPSLEARDVDALFRARPTGREFQVVMRNEALETHVVRSVNLLTVPRQPGTRVFADPSGTFREASELLEPMGCLASSEDCLSAVRSFDGSELFSLADSTDLAARKLIDLTFPALDRGQPGLVIASRQSLLPTYLLYQSLAYLGGSAGQVLAALERGDPAARRRADGIAKRLGGIEVLVPNSAGGWSSVAEVAETGPLGSDVRVISLPTMPGTVRVRLRLARGAWRIDYLALAALGDHVAPQRIAPTQVFKGAIDDGLARDELLDSTRVLVTYPGDEYTLVYQLPADFGRYELFLESQGYYLEWMRNEWVAEQNARRAAMMFLHPDIALRRLAPEYKRLEADIEKTFWSSRYARP